jgi:hypothetical protein|uniref:Uncharacterized protein n=1 Tax=Picea glauca TaxID=3330 RepID=A0A101LVF0_PICGL|nr:hypothetical protein ABT39_MTgene1885 [Picea glauca]QHR92527.1 hypothetical protein Q903MT_gene6573 [Picea sitchensis]
MIRALARVLIQHQPPSAGGGTWLLALERERTLEKIVLLLLLQWALEMKHLLLMVDPHLSMKLDPLKLVMLPSLSLLLLL